jgi:hypothetical protein
MAGVQPISFLHDLLGVPANRGGSWVVGIRQVVHRFDRFRTGTFHHRIPPPEKFATTPAPIPFTLKSRKFNLFRPSSKLEDSMTEYEIHILSRDGSSIVSTLKLFSVQGAISSAVRIARGRAFEVWSEGRCLYAGAARAVPPPAPPGQPAA